MPQVPIAVARRRFIQWLGLLFAAPLAGGARLALAQSAGPGGARSRPVPKPPAAPKPAPGPAAAPAPAPPSPEVAGQARALTDVVRSRYGKYLTDAQLEDMTKDFERSVQGADRLRKAGLKNSDEPDVTFRAALER